MKPIIRYYNGHFINGYDMILKNSISNLEGVLNINSDYLEKSKEIPYIKV
jgi:hypothetical protein